MNLPRVFYRPITEGGVDIIGTEVRHMKVRRLAAGDKVELFDGRGVWAEAVITAVQSRQISLQVEQINQEKECRENKIVIAASLARAERFDWLVSKCTELGVDRISPILWERTVKLARNPKVVQRWENLAVAAAKQCRRNFLPRIDSPRKPDQAWDFLTNQYRAGKMLLGSMDDQARSLMNLSPVGTDVIAWVGPEGGLTVQEERFFKIRNAVPVRLTGTTLRIETAALAFATLLTAGRYAQKK